MTIRPLIYTLIAAACLIAIAPPVLALADDAATSTVLYQTSFATDPRWTTNNPSTDYWNSELGVYHFSIEPSTGSYAYIPVDYFKGSFKMEYDVKFDRMDDGAAFRLGFSGPEMDFNKGPNVLTQFTNAKFGKIMWLQMVTQSNKQMKVNSQHGDELTSGPNAYMGPTVKYDLNKTYHVTVTYDDENRLLSTQISEKVTGKDVWGYYVNTGENLQGMNRIYLGSKGDYGMMGLYAQGYIDNVRLTAPATVTVTPTPVSTVVETSPITTRPTPLTTLKPASPTTLPPETTPQSPSSGLLPVAALSLAALVLGLMSLKRN